MFRFQSLTLLLLTATVCANDEIDFNRDIRPILSDKCFACHGPDEQHREGGFRFDQQESAFGEGESGEHPIVPGDPEKSELIARVTSDDEFLVMPPPEANKEVTAEEVAKLKAWIKAGAPWEEHWSFIPPTKPTPPEAANQTWGKNEIDAFILSRLEREGLEPAPATDKATLLRRVTFDLTGLPPTPKEVDAFLADESEDAYEKVIERLLGSERFGEHMARYWLDAVRYGDTHGLHLDNYREIWAYRDWVVKAFNNDMPFDQFIVEQLAGDLLPNATRDQLIATGFNRCIVTTSEGGSIKEEVLMRNVVDRVVATGTVFLGLTLDCTRCHDHKFDPLTMNDFYSLYAFFNSIDGSPLDGNKKDHEPVIKVPSPEQEQQLAEYDQQLADLRKKLNAPWPEVEQEQQTWEASLSEQQSANEIEWSTPTPTSFTSKGGADLQLLEDQSILASGENPAKEVYEVVLPLEGEGYKGIRLEGLIHESLTNGGAGRSSNSNVVLTEFEAFLGKPMENGEIAWEPLKISAAKADYEQPDGDFKVTNAIDAKPATGWAIAGHQKKENRTAVFKTATPFGAEGAQLKVVLKQESIYSQHQFGRIRLAVTKNEPIPVDVPQDILNIVRIETEKRNPEQAKKLREHFRTSVTSNKDYIAVRDELAATTKKRNDFNNQIPTTLVYREKAKPDPAYILKRGEYTEKGDERPRQTPASLPPLKEEWSKDRLGLAQWLIDPNHPLTARVTVNRFWQRFFGTGIVKTSEDFGSQGEPPSHPKLLDWLAVQFIQDGWDVKQSMRRIVLSATYRQSSKVSPELLKRDPNNRLLARGPRFRLDAEMLRDQALFVSGLLVEKLGGPSVKPPQPLGLWKAVGYTNSNTANFKADQGAEKVHRRTLYTFIKRTSPPPQMSTLDGPSREACCVRRERTNTPLQALLLFNDPQYVECAVGLASRVLREGENDRQRAERMLRLVLTRPVDDAEVDELLKAFEQDLKFFQENQDAAQQLVSVATMPVDEQMQTPALAAWTMAANLLLNLDEVVTKN